ncbi:LTA synthase family protein [Leucobacter zeae]|nr:LTA synthase family protein [Leucobacter zeae]
MSDVQQRPEPAAEVERGQDEARGAGAPRAAGRARRPERRRWWGFAIVCGWILVLAGALLFGAALWVRRTFGPVSVDQLLTNLPGGGGEGAGGQGLVISGVVTGLVIPAAAVLVVALLAEKSRRALRAHGIPRPGWPRIGARATAAVLALAVPAAGAVYAADTIGVQEYAEAVIREQVTGTSIADFYVAPELEGGSPGPGAADGTAADAVPGTTDDGRRRNLIVIYLESMENAFADDEVFERNMLEPVQRATRGWDKIPRLRQYEGGGWTMSGIVATQCGIPLRSAAAVADTTEMNKFGSALDATASYMPGATCLGDVLADRGYRNVFMGGADASFAGKGAFLASHGYDEVLDLREWRARGETETRPDWGLSDRRLFELAKDEVARLHEADQPFNLTMLSLDTHEQPHAYDYCPVDTEEEMTSITTCSMRQVAGFIDALDNRGYLEDTTVVVMGDHLKAIGEMNSFWEEMRGMPDRSIFNRVWSPDGVRFARADIDQFSMYPTLVELAGVELPGHRAGIGVSALAPERKVAPGSILDLEPSAYDAVVRSRASEFYRDIWRADPEAVDAEASESAP